MLPLGHPDLLSKGPILTFELNRFWGVRSRALAKYSDKFEEGRKEYREEEDEEEKDHQEKSQEKEKNVVHPANLDT